MTRRQATGSTTIAYRNRRVTIARHAIGLPVLEDFALVEETIDAVPPDQVLVAVDTLSVDAWILTTMSEAGLHTMGAIGSTVRAFGVGKVVESASPGFAPGDWVFGMLCAQSHALVPAAQLTKLEPQPGIDPRAYIGALGITTGLTAWVGLVAVGEVQAGDVVVVSGAAGAVGTCAVQIAKARGARVIGIAGGPAKCAYLRERIGADAAIDYKQGDVAAQIAAAAPEGIDLFFDNVGGEILDAALDNLRPEGGARVVICGAISQYADLADVRGPKLYLRLAERNAAMRGFVVSHHAARFAEANAELAGLIRAGKLDVPEHVVEPLDRFPEALRMLSGGGHTGNLVVRV